MTGRPAYRRRPASTTPYGAKMRETAFQGMVGAYCKDKGALHYHTHRSDRSEKGFPDSVILGNYLMFRELKSDTGRPTKEQREWIAGLCDAGYDADLWYPEDWRSGRCQNEINRCVRRRPEGSAIQDLIDLPKTLFLLASEGNEPAAALQWDAGVKTIDRERWERHSNLIIKEFLGFMPRTDVEINAWLARHSLTPDASPASVMTALRADIARSL